MDENIDSTKYAPIRNNLALKMGALDAVIVFDVVATSTLRYQAVTVTAALWLERE